MKRITIRAIVQALSPDSGSGLNGLGRSVASPGAYRSLHKSHKFAGTLFCDRSKLGGATVFWSPS